MSRLQECFSRLREQQRRALIPYITAGDPEPGVTVALMHAMVRSGADVIELGVPFSDPMADGPVIQRASERALKHQVNLKQVLQMVQRFRTDDAQTPVVLMGYLNPLEVMGYAAFADAAQAAGVDGVLTVDLPPEEADDLIAQLKPRAIDAIFLLAPTTDSARIRKVCALASGYLYYVSLKGVTGAQSLNVESVAKKLAEIRAVTTLPLGVGFGIKDANAAAAVARVADAVVVGSALIEKVERNIGQNARIEQAICELLSAMRNAMDQPVAVA
jgi:tryptophan synthase alpha chain